MKKLIRQLEQYLRETIGIMVTPHLWDKSNGLPQYLRERYRFFTMDILGIECLLMADTGEAEQPPAVIRKHMDKLKYGTIPISCMCVVRSPHTTASA